MKLRMFIMLIAVGVVFGAVFGMKWFGNKMMNEYTDKAPIPPATITAAAAATMSWDNRLEAIGSFVPVNGTDVTTESGGIITSIHFESGAQVEKGARLITLDSANEAAELKRLQAQADLAETNRVRREKLLHLEAISKSDYDAAASEAGAAKAAVDAQRAKLAQKNIHAPFAGVLGIRQVNLGQYLAPGTAIVTLQTLDPINFDFSLPEQQIATVQPGLKIAVKIDAYPDAEFTGEIAAIEPKVDEATRSFKLRARLTNSDLLLRGGQFGKVQLILPGERSLLVVPRTAISYNSYGTSVFVVQKKQNPAPAADNPGQDDNEQKEDKEEQKPAEEMAGAPPTTDLEVIQRFVKTGDAKGDFVAVVEGLKEGEQVATSGLLKLRNQQPVIINNSVMPEAELEPTTPQN
ncbi:MAG: efflux RND transporter periplasmic adaptor subunit [Nevskiales bacterium]